MLALCARQGVTEIAGLDIGGLHTDRRLCKSELSPPTFHVNGIISCWFQYFSKFVFDYWNYCRFKYS